MGRTLIAAALAGGGGRPEAKKRKKRHLPHLGRHRHLCDQPTASSHSRATPPREPHSTTIGASLDALSKRDSSSGDSASPMRDPPQLLRASTEKLNIQDQVALQVKEQLSAQQRAAHWYIVHPQEHPRALGCWDAISIVALLWTATITPYEVSFLPTPTTANDGLFIFNRLIDTVFFLDLLLQFVLMYRDVATNEWVSDPRRIVRNYLTTWFALDFLSIIPSVFEIVPIAAGGGGGGSGDDDDDSSLSKLKTLRVVRIARLVKLVKLFKTLSFVKKFQSRISIDYGIVSVIQAALQFMLVAHLVACVLSLQTTFRETQEGSWLVSLGYCEVLPPEALPPPPPAGADTTTATDAAADGDEAEVELECVGPGTLYIACLYWSLMLIVGLAGGPLERGAFSAGEQFVFLWLVIVTSLLWAQVVGQIFTVLATSNPDVKEARQLQDELNRFLRINVVPHEMRTQLREYFHQTFHLQRARERHKVMAIMSPKLQGQVALHLHRDSICKLPFLQGAEEGFFVQTAFCLQGAVFVPTELLPHGYFYIVERGVAIYSGRFYTNKHSNKCWGHDVILRRADLRLYAAQALTYVEVYRMSHVDLFELAQRYPRAHGMLRWAAIKLALVRVMVKMADQARLTDLEDEDEGENGDGGGDDGDGDGGGGGSGGGGGGMDSEVSQSIAKRQQSSSFFLNKLSEAGQASQAEQFDPNADRAANPIQDHVEALLAGQESMQKELGTLHGDIAKLTTMVRALAAGEPLPAAAVADASAAQPAILSKDSNLAKLGPLPVLEAGAAATAAASSAAADSPRKKVSIAPLPKAAALPQKQEEEEPTADDTQPRLAPISPGRGESRGTAIGAQLIAATDDPPVNPADVSAFVSAASATEPPSAGLSSSERDVPPALARARSQRRKERRRQGGDVQVATPDAEGEEAPMEVRRRCSSGARRSAGGRQEDTFFDATSTIDAMQFNERRAEGGFMG